jgi:hypothetical protein
MEPLAIFVVASVSMLLSVRMIEVQPFDVLRVMVRTRGLWVWTGIAIVALLLTVVVDAACGIPLVSTRLIAAGLLPVFLGWIVSIVLIVGRIKRGLCPKCAYDLRGSRVDSSACPECGAPSPRPSPSPMCSDSGHHSPAKERV